MVYCWFSRSNERLMLDIRDEEVASNRKNCPEQVRVGGEGIRSLLIALVREQSTIIPFRVVNSREQNHNLLL